MLSLHRNNDAEVTEVELTNHHLMKLHFPALGKITQNLTEGREGA